MAHSRPLAIDLFTGLHGWADGLIAEGWSVIGFDIRDMSAACGVEKPLHFQLVLQDVLTLHGSQFKDAALIVASPPCQAYSYRAMPWKRAKALPPPDNTLFDACFRIQREACESAGRHIPLIVENVRGAQKWVGRAKWNYGSFYLWGDVPALMPMTLQRRQKFQANCAPRMWRDRDVPRLNDGSIDVLAASVFHMNIGSKNTGGSWFNVARNTTSGKGNNPDGRKGKGAGAEWFDQNLCVHPSKSPKRKMASALIAKIPEPLARHIARTFHPRQHRNAA